MDLKLTKNIRTALIIIYGTYSEEPMVLSETNPQTAKQLFAYKT